MKIVGKDGQRRLVDLGVTDGKVELFTGATTPMQVVVEADGSLRGPMSNLAADAHGQWSPYSARPVGSLLRRLQGLAKVVSDNRKAEGTLVLP